jgi:uncharacterized protein YhfF
VLCGEKVATSSLLLQYENEGEPPPQPGDRRVIVDSSGAPVAVVELRDVGVIRLGDADLQLALDEDEGFTSVEEWRAAHVAFWDESVRPGLHHPGEWRLDDDTKVVVERFRVNNEASAGRSTTEWPLALRLEGLPSIARLALPLGRQGATLAWLLLGCPGRPKEKPRTTHLRPMTCLVVRESGSDCCEHVVP